MDVFFELSIVIVVALLVSSIARLLRQPLIIGYIITGILLGGYGLNVIQSGDTFEIFSRLGVSMLLFIVGLQLSPNVIRELGKVSVFIGVAQIVVTTVIGFCIAFALGIDHTAALYIAVAFTFSSTIIILKLLADKGDIHKLYGKITIGFLLVQDIVAAMILLVMTTLGIEPQMGDILAISAQGIFFIIVVFLVSRYILPQISQFLASSQEYLFLFALAWGLGISAIFTQLGLSAEIGAIIAGVAFSMTPYSYEAASRLRPIRDFFILIFFILLGSHMVFSDLWSLLIPAIIFSLFILIGQPIIMLLIMNTLGFSKRTSFQTAVSIAQVSEFSLILASVGFAYGHISALIVSLITTVALISIAASSYYILYSEEIYRFLEKYLEIFQLNKTNKNQSIHKNYQAILFGYGRVGRDFVETFEHLNMRFVVIDFDPKAIEQLKNIDIPCIYGDAKDTNFLEELQYSSLQYVVATFDELDTNLQLIRKIRSVNKRAIIVVISHNREESLVLYAEGASYVIMPHYLGAQYATRLMTKHGANSEAYRELREKHLLHLESSIGL